MASILITGGAGFIGSHTGDALLARGHRHLPQLQRALLGNAVMGYEDLFVAALLGALVAATPGLARRAAAENDNFDRGAVRLDHVVVAFEHARQDSAQRSGIAGRNRPARGRAAVAQ